MDFTKLKKLESMGARPAHSDADRVVTAIVKVKKAGYCPEKAKVRSKVNSHLLTAEIKTRDLGELEADPDVESVSLARALPLQKLPT
jgi:hypothetical protein